jgi:hypothetical protein
VARPWNAKLEFIIAKIKLVLAVPAAAYNGCIYSQSNRQFAEKDFRERIGTSVSIDEGA